MYKYFLTILIALLSLSSFSQHGSQTPEYAISIKADTIIRNYHSSSVKLVPNINLDQSHMAAVEVDFTWTQIGKVHTLKCVDLVHGQQIEWVFNEESKADTILPTIILKAFYAKSSPNLERVITFGYDAKTKQLIGIGFQVGDFLSIYRVEPKMDSKKKL